VRLLAPLRASLAGAVIVFLLVYWVPPPRPGVYRAKNARKQWRTNTVKGINMVAVLYGF